MYLTKFRGTNEALTTSWAPTEGAYEVPADVAVERYEDLLKKGREGVAVEGVVPWHVEIVDPRSGLVMLTRTTEEGDVDGGVWTRRHGMAA